MPFGGSERAAPSRVPLARTVGGCLCTDLAFPTGAILYIRFVCIALFASLVTDRLSYWMILCIRQNKEVAQKQRPLCMLPRKFGDFDQPSRVCVGIVCVSYFFFGCGMQSAGSEYCLGGYSISWEIG